MSFSENLPSNYLNMDDSARGMASKILCDLLNIPKKEDASGNTATGAGTYRD